MDWLTTRPTGDEVLNTFAMVSLIVFTLVLIVAGFYNARPWASPVGEPFSKHFVRRATALLGWSAGLGLFFLIVRLLQIDPATFGRPVWIVLSWIALIVTVVVIALLAPKDRELKRLRRAGHRPSQLGRRPVRKRGTI